MTTHILAERIELLENTLNAEARTVDVVLIRPGWSANGRYYSRNVLAQAASLFEGVKAYANHPTREQLKRGESRSVLDITGRYTGVHVGQAGELRATREVFGKAGDAVWPLIEQSVGTPKPVIGVSINALGKAKKGTADGKEGIIVESIEVANSADDVDTPAAGGGFERLVMGNDTSLVHDLLQTLTYDEFVEARPDYIETLRKQMKRARQTEQVRALTEERDAAQAALADARVQVETLTQQLADVRADYARQTQLIVLEQALRAANFTAEHEKLLRQQLEQADPSEWLSIIQAEKDKLRAASVRRVPVHGAPLRERQEPVALREPSGPIRPEDYPTPYAFYEAVQRRRAAKGKK
jgi:hypothetical protein